MGRNPGGVKEPDSGNGSGKNSKLFESEEERKANFKQLKLDFYKVVSSLASSERLNTPVNEIWLMSTYDFLTYISVFIKDAEQQKIDNMSEEDKILLGKCNNIATSKQLNSVNESFK